ncbi:hypothetical protein HPB51_007523 [Rhipicephalus microplus]|uniref:Uncharacterized protein n=1 Tax=Rhipicephalus microplus TaxID=6941 RepID=A0A9J6E807_RHIMP|nr:hypothetical protein HPB51_007523 [Rhipicephalus microplus]
MDAPADVVMVQETYIKELPKLPGYHVLAFQRLHQQRRCGAGGVRLRPQGSHPHQAQPLPRLRHSPRAVCSRSRDRKEEAGIRFPGERLQQLATSQPGLQDAVSQSQAESCRRTGARGGKFQLDTQGTGLPSHDCQRTKYARRGGVHAPLRPATAVKDRHLDH